MGLNKHIIIIIIIIITVAVAKNLLDYSSEEVILRIILCPKELVSNLGFFEVILLLNVTPCSIMTSCRRS